MAARWLGIVACTALVTVSAIDAQTPPKPAAARGWRVARTPDGKPDLQGFWTNTTATPLQRPREFGDKSRLTKAEAAEYERTWMARLIADEDEETARVPISTRSTWTLAPSFPIVPRGDSAMAG